MPAHLLQIAKKLAHDAGKLALEYQVNGFKTESKGGVDLVTEADKACEELILKTIKGNFPDHAILTEESGMIGDPKAEYKWIVDPIDGTTNFAHGVPYYCISIAIVHKGLPIIGVVEAPALKEIFWAQKGKGAYKGNTQIHVSRTHNMNQAIAGVGFPYDRNTEATKLSYSLTEATHQAARGVRRLGAAALEICYVASSQMDAFWHYKLKPWDFAAGKIILEEAGGMMTDVTGQTLTPKNGRVLATNGLLHQEMVNLIKSKGGDQVM